MAALDVQRPSLVGFGRKRPGPDVVDLHEGPAGYDMERPAYLCACPACGHGGIVEQGFSHVPGAHAEAQLDPVGQGRAPPLVPPFHAPVTGVCSGHESERLLSAQPPEPHLVAGELALHDQHVRVQRHRVHVHHLARSRHAEVETGFSVVVAPVLSGPIGQHPVVRALGGERVDRALEAAVVGLAQVPGHPSAPLRQLPGPSGHAASLVPQLVAHEAVGEGHPRMDDAVGLRLDFMSGCPIHRPSAQVLVDGGVVHEEHPALRCQKQLACCLQPPPGASVVNNSPARVDVDEAVPGWVFGVELRFPHRRETEADTPCAGLLGESIGHHEQDPVISRESMLDPLARGASAAPRCPEQAQCDQQRGDESDVWFCSHESSPESRLPAESCSCTYTFSYTMARFRARRHSCTRTCTVRLPTD